MTSTAYKSKQLSFWQLIRTNQLIEIPIVQRDYAQGREDKDKIRNKFLDELFKSFTGDPIELDFVYGSEKGKALQPLDGQQRLTTLFLLHWYIALKNNALNDEIERELQKFSYATRISSREFCRKLIKSRITVDPESLKISREIKDLPWFYSSWERDPTIKAMLIMLDAIHQRFKNSEVNWDALTSENIRPITFHYLNLDDFGLSDDLYIKMNARGKQLSAFENFKADIIKHIGKNGWEEGKKPVETFAHKADTAWTDLFWDNGNGEQTFDSSFINIISNSVLCSWANRSEKTKENERKVLELFNNPGGVSHEDIGPAEYDRLFRDLELYSYQNNSKLEIDLPCWNLMPRGQKNLFSIVAGGKATYPQRLMFYAQTAYLSSGSDFDPISFGTWMRVVRNIALNSSIDSVQTFSGAINLVNELAAGSHGIYTFLSTNAVQSNFASSQVKEETEKADLINNETIDAIFNAEDTNFCRGKIEFILYTVKNKETDGFDFLKMTEINKVLDTYFDGNDVTNEFRRAMLTIGDQEFYKFWDSWTSAIQENKYSLIRDISDLRTLSSRTDFRSYLKSMLRKLVRKTPAVLISEFLLKNEGDENIPKWKMRLISQPKLLDKYCQSHCIAIPESDKFCFLLRVERPRDRDSCKRIN